MSRIPRFCIDIRAAVTLAQQSRDAEIHMAVAIGGARYGLGFRDGSSIRRSPNDTPASARNFSNLDLIVDPLVAGRAISLVLIGTDMPTWAAYKTAVGGTWGSEPHRPPVEAWPHWAADAQACVDYIRAKYSDAGLDPDEYAWFQIANEVNQGGSGGPWATTDPFTYAPPYDNLDPGEFDGPGAGLNGWDADYPRNVGDQLEYLVNNVDFRGSPVVGVAHETQTGTDFTNEKASLPQLAGHFHGLTHLAMNDYHGLTLAESLSKRQFARAWVRLCQTERAELLAAYVDAGLVEATGMPWVLSEVGINLSQCNFGSAPLDKHGHFARGEYLRRILVELFRDGRFELISLYVSRSRTDGESATATYALADFAAAYFGSWRAIGNMHGLESDAPPAVSTSEDYVSVSDESFSVPETS